MKTNDLKSMARRLQEVREPYAVGMAKAMKSTGDKPPLEKSTIKKAHKIAKSIQKEGAKLDPVDKKAAMKKFDKRKDKDIDNDGDTDSSDKYLHKKRKAITKSVKSDVDTETQVQEKMSPSKKARMLDKMKKTNKRMSSTNRSLSGMRRDAEKMASESTFFDRYKRSLNEADAKITHKWYSVKHWKDGSDHFDNLDNLVGNDYKHPATDKNVRNRPDHHMGIPVKNKKAIAYMDKHAKGVNEQFQFSEEKMKGEDPCWDSHEMQGHKMKNGKKVPNCVPKEGSDPAEKDSKTYKKSLKKELQSEAANSTTGPEPVHKLPPQPGDAVQGSKEVKQPIEKSATPDQSKLDKQDREITQDGEYAIVHNKKQEKESQSDAASGTEKDTMTPNESYNPYGGVTNPETRKPASMREALSMMYAKTTHTSGATTPEGMMDKVSPAAKAWAEKHSVATPPQADIDKVLDMNKTEVDASLRRSVDYRNNDQQIGDKKPVGNDGK